MGTIFKFAKTNNQILDITFKSKFTVIDVLPSQSGTLTYNGKEQTPTWLNLDPIKLLIEGETSATEAGTHYIMVTPMGNFAWADKSQDTKQVAYTIKRAPISTLPSQSGTLTYNGSNQTPTWKNYDANQLIISGTYADQKNAKSYDAVFTPDSNHCWSDGTYVGKISTWKIDKLSLTKPTANGSPYTYNGGNITLQMSNFNSTYMSVTGNTGKNVSTLYEATVSLKDKNNTQWTGGSTDDVKVPWAIKKLDVQIPSVEKDVTYTGSSQSPTLINSSSWYTLGGDTSGTDIGSYNLTLTLKDPTNTQWVGGSTAEKTVAWRIDKESIAVPVQKDFVTHGEEMYASYFTYDDSKVTLTSLGDDSSHTAGTHTATFTLINSNSCKWADGTSTASHSVSWVRNPAKLTKPSFKWGQNTFEYWSGTSNHTVDIRDYLDDFDSNLMNISGYSSSTVGEYEASITIKNTNYYHWSDDSTAAVKLKWYYNAEKIDKPTLWGSTSYTEQWSENISTQKFSAQLSGYDGNTMTLSSDPTLSNAKTYTVTVTPKTNFCWSDTKDRSSYTLTYILEKAEIPVGEITHSRNATGTFSGNDNVSAYPSGSSTAITIRFNMPDGYSTSISIEPSGKFSMSTTTDMYNRTVYTFTRGSGTAVGTTATVYCTLKKTNYNDKKIQLLILTARG